MEHSNIDERRRTGFFPTPQIWADYAHSRLSSILGPDWYSEFVVWDPACGTGNLTKSYSFKNLYSSTLMPEELSAAALFNREAEHFQFDFLNDYIPMPGELVAGETKMPKGLLEAFMGDKKILFFLNPPYARNNGGGFMSNATSTTVSDTKLNVQMKAEGYGACSANLYAQFLYGIEKIKREYKLTNCYIGIFCKSLFLTGGSYDKFREHFLNDFEYIDGFQFNAKHFADCSDAWGVLFSMWKSGETEDKENFTVDNCDIKGDVSNNEIIITDKKCLYNIGDNETASEWVLPSGKYEKMNVVPLTSGLKIGNNTTSKMNKGTLGGLVNKGNNVQQSAQLVAILNGRFNDKGTRVVDIMPENFTKCVALFSARRLITGKYGTWINDKDEYLAPNESHQKFEEFVNDSVIFSLFESASNQSSLCQVKYKEKLWDIKNEFFWMSRAEIMDFADEAGNNECYEQAAASSDRYVYKYLAKVTLSPEAQEVLELAEALVRESFKYREMFGDDYPDYQINNWDCGYYQLKKLWSEYLPEEFREFRLAFGALASAMRPMVYELGFLKK